MADTLQLILNDVMEASSGLSVTTTPDGEQKFGKITNMLLQVLRCGNAIMSSQGQDVAIIKPKIQGLYKWLDDNGSYVELQPSARKRGNTDLMEVKEKIRGFVYQLEKWEPNNSSRAEYDKALLAFASYGIGIQFPQEMINRMKFNKRNRTMELRQTIKMLTTYNSKLGLNWRSDTGTIVGWQYGNGTHQLQTSVYKTYVGMAGRRLQNAGYTKWGGFLSNYAQFGYDWTVQKLEQERMKQANQPQQSAERSKEDLEALIQKVISKHQVAMQDEFGVPDDQSSMLDQSFAQMSDVYDADVEEAIYGDIKANAVRGMVRIDDLTEAFMRLPRLLQLIGERMGGDSNEDYLVSLLSPFHYSAKGTRIPNIQATMTVCATDFQDLGTFSVTNGSGLFMTNYTAVGCSPWMYLNAVQQLTFDAPVLKSVQVQGVSNAPGISSPVITWDTDLIRMSNDSAWRGGQFLLDNLTIGVAPDVQGLFTSARIVSAGTRFFKTSASTTESGVIKGYYAERGGRVNKNLGQLINYYQDDYAHVRIYAAGSAGESMGRAGFMLGSIYQPTDLVECQDFVDTSRTFLNTRAKIPNNAFLSLQTLCPIGMIFELTGDIPTNWPAGQPGAGVGRYYQLDRVFFEAIVEQPAAWADVDWYLDASSLLQPHVAVYAFEGLQPDTTFEFQFVSHKEGVPSGESQYLETDVCVLDNQYSTPLDILRRVDVSSLRTGPDLNIDDPNMEVLAGLLQHGFFVKPRNMIHKMQEGIRKHHKIADKILDFTPHLARKLIEKIPGADLIADPVVDGIKHVIKKHRDRRDEDAKIKSVDIATINRVNNAERDRLQTFAL